MQDKREFWLDWLRVTALFLVMATHSCEPFYLGGEGSLIASKSDAIWVAVLNSVFISRNILEAFFFYPSFVLRLWFFFLAIFET